MVKKITSVTIERFSGQNYYEAGQCLILKGKEANIKVREIKTSKAKEVFINLSNGEILEFNGFPFILSKK